MPPDDDVEGQSAGTTHNGIALVTVGIVSDRVLTRAGLRALSVEAGVHVGAESDTTAARQSELYTCNVVLLDLSTSGLEDCVAVCDRMRGEQGAPPLIGIDEGDRASPRFARVMEAGLTSYVDIERGLSLSDVIRETLGGRSVVHRVRRRDTISLEIGDADAAILRLLAEGLTDAGIASRLKRGESTVKHRLEDMTHDLGASNRVQLAGWAAMHGLTTNQAITPRR